MRNLVSCSKSGMIRIACNAWLALLATACVGTSQAPDYRMQYEVGVDTVGHYLNVGLQLTGVSTFPEGNGVVLSMPVWAPGYYVVVDFPKHLTDFVARKADGTPLTWHKLGKNKWLVDNAGSDTVCISYRIFANEKSVAEARVSDGAAFIPGNGVYMHVDGDIDHEVAVHFRLPDNWTHISTGLPCNGEQYVASDFDVLYDSPVLLGTQRVDSFSFEGHQYEFAFEQPGDLDKTDFFGDFRRIVHAATQLMGHVPYDRYCLLHLCEGRGGLEHLNSQACYIDNGYRFASADDYISHLDFVAHEYYHLYNVKHIRPIELGPFDYDREVFTPLLWVSEGFTCYYSAQLLYRSGIIGRQKMLDMLSEYIRDTESHEGHRHMSLRQSSYDIWLNFFNRDANGSDQRISYYVKGPVLGLLFDCQLRAVSQRQRSLDDLMRLLYNRYDQQLGRGFTEEEFWQSVLEVAGDDGAVRQLRRYVDTTADIDYAALLSPMGLLLDTTTWQLSASADAPYFSQQQ